MTLPTKTPPAGDIMEAVLIKGNLAKLTPDESVQYYNAVCKSIGLNPLTRPLEYLDLQGKRVLYARRDAADQLRKLNGISINIVSQEQHDGLLTVHVRAKDKDGREDEDLGVVPFPDTLKGEARSNQILKCVTKAKRRVTLSISGLGFLDETEVESIPNNGRKPKPPAPNVMTATINPETGEITEPPPETAPDAAEPAPPSTDTSGGGAALSITEVDAQLAEAAEQGLRQLQQVWTALPRDQKEMLKASLDRRHKRRAMEVDNANRGLMEENK